jgi:hypothetical protein
MGVILQKLPSNLAIGTMVVCVDDGGCNYITKGEMYPFRGHEGLFIETRDDQGGSASYRKCRFRVEIKAQSVDDHSIF